jgi:hypothetical protein
MSVTIFNKQASCGDIDQIISIGWIGSAPNGFGTTPNIAPPSNLKFPVSIGYSFIFFFERLKFEELKDSN